MPYLARREAESHRPSSARRAPPRHPPLEPTEEREVVVAAQGGDAVARERLVAVFLPSIGLMARRYRGSTLVDRSELTQEGVVGLLTALERFDPDRGTPFWAYASWWVRQSMQQVVAQLTRPVVMSDRALRQLARVNDAQREHLQARKGTPTASELAERTGLARAQVESLIAVDRVPSGFEEPINNAEQAGATVGDLVSDPRSEDAYDRVVSQLAGSSLRELPGGLTERERTVVEARYGFAGPEQTLGQIGGGLGVSAERVRQIEAQALEKVRAVATAENPDD
jgi:RNA polymerase sigma factor (sigma-70 family)